MIVHVAVCLGLTVGNMVLVLYSLAYELQLSLRVKHGGHLPEKLTAWVRNRPGTATTYN